MSGRKQPKQDTQKLDAKALAKRLVQLKVYKGDVLKDLYKLCGSDIKKKAEITRSVNSAQREYDKTLLLLKDLI